MHTPGWQAEGRRAFIARRRALRPSHEYRTPHRRSRSHRWYGEAEGLKGSLAGANAKLAQMDQISAGRDHQNA